MVLTAYLLYFNSRPHEEVDEFIDCYNPPEKNFNSRPHEEVDINQAVGFLTFYVFQLTTSRGGRQKVITCFSQQGYFNSRPHEEVDKYRKSAGQFNCISTHDLTRRSTRSCKKGKQMSNISTHDLTRRSTHRKQKRKVANIFQLTTSRGGRQLSGRRTQSYSYFNSRPHEEVDLLSVRKKSLSDISTHDLTRRSTWMV